MSALATTASWRELPLKFAVQDAQTGIWGEEPNGGDDDIVCARVADFDRVKAKILTVPTIRRVSEKDRAKCGLRRDDLLIEKSGGTERNPVGTAVLYQGPVPAVYANFILRLRMKDDHDPRFWLYALHSSHTSGRTWNYVRQTTGIQNLDVEGFLSMKHAAPDQGAQERIADYLDCETGEIDAMIAKMDQLAGALEARRRRSIDAEFTLISDVAPLWSLTDGIIDCPHTTPELDDEGTAEAIRTASVRSGKYIAGRGIRVSAITAQNRNGEYPPRPGDIFFTREAPAGEAALVPEGDFCLGQRMVLIRIEPTKTDSRFVLYALYTSNIQQEFLLAAGGSTVVNLKLGTIRTTQLPYVALDEQQRIADRLDEVTSRIDAMLVRVAELKSLLTERRAALITDVVTGRKEVA